MRLFDKVHHVIDNYGLVKIFLLIFLFLQPFSRVTSVKESAFVLLLLLFVIKSIKKGLVIDYKDRIIQALILLVAACIVSSVFSPYHMDSFTFLRKSLLYQLVVFIVIINEFDGKDGVRPLVYALLGSFAALSLIILITRPPDVILHWLDATTHGDRLLIGYSLYATFYIPLGISYLYASRGSNALKALLVFFILLEFVFSILNNHRGQVVAVIISAVVITILARRYKTLIAGLAAAALIGATLLYLNPNSFDRYKTILTTEAYITKTVKPSGAVEYEGMTDRLGIWKGTLDLIKERPLIGYGYGWKKIAYAVADGGWLERWDKESRTYYYFSKWGYGSANPHNLALQILFEVGVIGLLAFLFFWSAIFWKALSQSRKDSGSGAALLLYSVVGVLVSYGLVNLVNGLWEESFGILMMSFAGLAFVLQRESATSKFRGKWR